MPLYSMQGTVVPVDPPSIIAANVTITSGSTTAFTATGGSTGVPAGARLVLVNIYYNSASSGVFLTSKPTGGSAAHTSSYPLFGLIQVASSTVCGFATMRLSTGGQFDLTANNATCLGIEICIMGYIM